MKTLRIVLGDATAPKRVAELRSILASQIERLSIMKAGMIQKGSWTARDGEGWVNHSNVDGGSSNDVAVTIRRGDLVVVLSAKDIRLDFDEDVYGAEGNSCAPFPASTADGAVERMIETIRLFDAVLADRSSTRAMRSGRPQDMALLTAVEERLRLVGSLAVAEGASAGDGVQVQAPTPWSGIQAVGMTGRDRWSRLLTEDRYAGLWKGLPRIVRLEISPAATEAERRLTGRKGESWRVDLLPTTVEWTDSVDSVVERMRMLGRLAELGFAA